MPRYDSDSEIWRFETARFVVTCNVHPEEDDPADHFEFAEDVEFAREDEPAHWFSASVTVWLKSEGEPYTAYGSEPGDYLGHDSLGCCSYLSWSDFLGGRDGLWPKKRPPMGGDYFPSMVREAISEARRELTRMGELAATMRRTAA